MKKKWLQWTLKSLCFHQFKCVITDFRSSGFPLKFSTFPNKVLESTYYRVPSLRWPDAEPCDIKSGVAAVIGRIETYTRHQSGVEIGSKFHDIKILTYLYIQCVHYEQSVAVSGIDFPIQVKIKSLTPRYDIWVPRRPPMFHIGDQANNRRHTKPPPMDGYMTW